MKMWWIVLGCLVASTVASFVIFSGVLPSNTKQVENLSASGSANLDEAQPTPPPPDPLEPVNFLMLGYGGAGHDGAYLSDTMLVVKVIPREKRAVMLSIPRDLWVKLPFESGGADFYTKINAAYSIGIDDEKYPDKPEEFTGKDGGGNLAKTVVAEIIGEPIDYYVGVDFESFKAGFNKLGGGDGLTIDVPYSFTDEFYPIEGEENNECGFSQEEIAALMEQYTGYELERQFACRYETISWEKGKHTMTADEALKFVRSRHSAVGGSDFGRSQRQQALLTSIRSEVLTPSFILKVPSLFMDFSKSVATDVDIKYVTKALTNYGDLRDYEIESFVLDNTNVLVDGRSRDGQYILQPKLGQDQYDGIQEFFEEKVASGGAEVNER